MSNQNQKKSKLMSLCWNWKGMIVLLGIGVALFMFFPGKGWALAPFLLFALCPLSMLIMMVGMRHNREKAEKLFVCPECGLAYREAGWAKKCAAWCKEHQSCNLEITAHAVEDKKD